MIGKAPAAHCSKAELALKKRFEDAYARSVSPVMQAIERKVCGCDYGGNSWTTQDQVDEMIGLLELGPRTRLAELGAGSGWPGLYMAKASDCTVALVDLPEIGLRIAAERAEKDGIAHRITTVVADAGNLPFPDNSFDAISHNDLLCCLERKAAVLSECSRILRDGRMVFTVISILPGLDRYTHARAVTNAPDFVETETGYATLLRRTGWIIERRDDLTSAYQESCARQLAADTEHRAMLSDLIGAAAVEERLASWSEKLRAICDGLLLRELFLCRVE